jgi:hypothetical protein
MGGLFVLGDTWAQRETGNRRGCWGDEFGCRVTAIRESAFQPSAAGSRFPRLMAESPIPEPPTSVAVTRHLEWIHLGQHAVLPLPRDRRMRCHRIPTRGRSRHLKNECICLSYPFSPPFSPQRSPPPSPPVRLSFPVPIRLAPSEIWGLMEATPYAHLVAPRPLGFRRFRDGRR